MHQRLRIDNFQEWIALQFLILYCFIKIATDMQNPQYVKFILQEKPVIVTLGKSNQLKNVI